MPKSEALMYIITAEGISNQNRVLACDVSSSTGKVFLSSLLTTVSSNTRMVLNILFSLKVAMNHRVIFALQGSVAFEGKYPSARLRSSPYL